MINVYINSRKIKKHLDNIYIDEDNGNNVYKYNGDVIIQSFRNYIINGRLYTVIDGVSYNTAKLLYDSINYNNLPAKRYKVWSEDPLKPTKDNIHIGDMREEICIPNSFIQTKINGIETSIECDYLMESIINGRYELVTKDE